MTNDPAASRTVNQRVVCVTGPSGAGRSTTINALEDLGYEAIDNMPLALTPRLFDGEPLERPLALGVDLRTRGFSVESFLEMKTAFDREPGITCSLLFLDCNTETLLRRYAETRRRHPAAPAEYPAEGVARERDLLDPIRQRADFLIDTSDLSPHDLRAEIARWFSSDESLGLAVSLHSFSYKRGMPRGLDMVFDCRFLRNPYWDEALRPLDGRDAQVAAHVQGDPRYDAFFEKLLGLTELLLPAQVEEGKAHLAIGFGCTGGRHRSVTVTESLADTLAKGGWRVSKRHRELERR